MTRTGPATFWMNSPPPVEPLRLRRVPLLAVALCFAAGIAVAHSWQPTLLFLAATLAQLILTFAALRCSPRISLVPVLGLWAVLGCWCARMEPPLLPQPTLLRLADGLSRTVRGHVTRIRELPPAAPDPASSPDAQQPWQLEPGAWETDAAPARQSIDLALSAVEELTPDTSTLRSVTGGLRLTLTGTALPLHCGDILELPARLRTPDNFRTPGTFAYSGQLLAEGNSVTASTRSSLVRVIGHSPAVWRCGLYRVQSWASARLEAFVASPPDHLLPPAVRLGQQDAVMLSAMLFGDRTRLTHTLRESFERTGTFHLFVVSGLHVALLAAGLFWLLLRLRLPMALAVLLTIVLTTAYTLLTGFGVPAQRALLMTSVYLVARWLDRETSALNILGAAAIAVLALSPRALFEASFQMTFLVILAIAGLGVPVAQRLTRRYGHALRNLDAVIPDAHMHPQLAALRVRLRMACDLCGQLLHPRLRRLPAWTFSALLHLLDAIVIGLAAELCMMLPMAVYFHRATLLVLPLNLIAVPLLGLLLAAAVLTFCAALLSPWLAMLPAALTALVLHLLRSGIGLARNAPFADLRLPAPSAPAIVAAALTVAFGCVALRARSRPWLIAAVAAAVVVPPLAVLWPSPPRLHPGVLEVTALDVGQGDSLLVVSPTGKTLLVDAGGPVGRGPNIPASSFDFGEQIVAPYLWSRHIRRLDAVLLTHAHSDHMGGLAAVLRDLHPSELWLSVIPDNSPALQALLTEASALHITVRHYAADDLFLWGGLTATVLAPEPGYANLATATNNDSLVLRLDLGRASVLLEGDAERPSEDAMVANHRLAPVTLLKVGHHGSRTSTNPEFLAAVAPRLAVISVGQHNTFGHPRAEVLARLEAAHVRTFRTDRQGAETFLLTPDGGISTAPASSNQ